MKFGDSKFSSVVVLGIVLNFAGCASGKSPDSGNQGADGGSPAIEYPGNPDPGPGTAGSGAAPLALAHSDIALFAGLDASGPAALDELYNGVFTSIFGGTRGAQVLSYFSTRVSHLVDLNQVSFRPNNFANMRWAQTPTPSGLGELAASGGKTGAINIGTFYWLEGLINQVPVQFYAGDGSPAIAVDSSRVGIVILGPGFQASEDDGAGHSIVLPPEYRQSILLHEARHSDCTSGITEAQLQGFRDASDSSAFEKKFASMPCGHLHRVCKSGPFVGIAACDSEAWGAYTVGAVYARASIQTARSDMDRAIMKFMYADQISRVQVNVEELFAGHLGRPDMSSLGYTRTTTPAPAQ